MSKPPQLIPLRCTASGQDGIKPDVWYELSADCQRPRCSLAEPTTGTTPHDLQRLRSQAWAEVAAIEASDSRLHRAIQDQQQYLQSMGVLS